MRPVQTRPYQFILVNRSNEALADAVGHVCNQSVPAQWHDEDYTPDCRKVMAHPDCINVVMLAGGRPVGCVLAARQSVARPLLAEYDPDMPADDRRFYVWIAAILPEHRSLRAFRTMLDALEDEARRRGALGLSAHARVVTGLARVVQRFWAGYVTTARRMETWSGYNHAEPTDYLELALRPARRAAA